MKASKEDEGRWAQEPEGSVHAKLKDAWAHTNMFERTQKSMATERRGNMTDGRETKRAAERHHDLAIDWAGEKIGLAKDPECNLHIRTALHCTALRVRGDLTISAATLASVTSCPFYKLADPVRKEAGNI